MRPFLFSLLLALTLRGAENPAATVAASGPLPFIVGISPYLDRSVKDDVYRGVVRLLLEDLPLDSTLRIYDAFEMKTITQVTVPNLRAFDSPKTRANQFAPAIRDIKRFLAQEHPRPASSDLNFNEAIRLPQFCNFLARNLVVARSPLPVLLFGSPLYQDAKEPAFSMVDGYFPSDGHLRASREESVFGTDGGQAPPLLVYWVYFADPWVSDLHREKVTRFWTLYLEQRGGHLAALSGDLASALGAFHQGAAGFHAGPEHWTADTRQTKVEMLRITRAVPAVDWLTRDGLPEAAPQPPAVPTGPMKIGVRWREDIDLDLYVLPRRGGETLFFQHPRSPEGYYYKDHRSSPGRDYEFVEFESPVDAREVEAYVNFYAGAAPGGVRGEARIEFAGRIYGAPFAIRAAAGNQGRSGHAQRDFWTRIPIQEILHLAP